MKEQLAEHIDNEQWESALNILNANPLLLDAISLEDLLQNKVRYQANEILKYSDSSLYKLILLDKLIDFCVSGGLKPKTIFESAILGDIIAIERLLDEGHFIDDHAFDERTGLIIAALFNNFDLCKFLMQRGAHIMHDDYEHNTAIDYTSSPEIFQLLKQAGAATKSETNQMANEYADAMEFANDLRDTQIEFMRGAENGNIAQMENALNKPKGWLALHGTYPVNGKTALHLAVERNNIGSVKFLLLKGLDKTKQDLNGESPIDIANRLNLHDILQLLAQSETKR